MERRGGPAPAKQLRQIVAAPASNGRGNDVLTLCGERPLLAAGSQSQRNPRAWYACSSYSTNQLRHRLATVSALLAGHICHQTTIRCCVSSVPRPPKFRTVKSGGSSVLERSSCQATRSQSAGVSVQKRKAWLGGPFAESRRPAVTLQLGSQ